MDMGLHIRDVSGIDFNEFLKFFQPLGDLPNGTPNPPPSRVYVGDEFCVHRLPSPAQLIRFCHWADDAGLELTLLTPILSDAGIAACGLLFDTLADWNPNAEVVVNDWGVLRCLQDRYPNFCVGAGRLLDKGFKDPRTPKPDQRAKATPLVSAAAFDHGAIRDALYSLGVRRLERDLLPHCGYLAPEDARFGLSVYYPFGCFTTGRVCWPASLRQNFVPAAPCDRTCEKLSLWLRHPDFALPVFQNGNTLFYRYSSAMVSTLWDMAKNRPMRLVFQEWALKFEGAAPSISAP